MILFSLQYILSDDNTARVIEQLEAEIALIRRCDEWRRANHVRKLAYDVKRTSREREATDCCLDKYGA